MRTLAFVVLSTIALAACDAPDPSAFHHALRSDAMTGSRLSGEVGSSEVGTADNHQIEQMQRQGSINQLKNQ
jgi:hypothetical protein